MRASIILKLLFSIVVPLLLTSCDTCRECGYCVHGIDEFVIDSYKIRQGKLAIIEMEGEELAEVPEDAMDEYIDVIHEDDVLGVGVYHPCRQDLMKAVETVNKDVGFRVCGGKIDLPGLQGVTVAGLTLEEAHDYISKIYDEQIKGIEIFLSYKDRPSHRVELAGLVGTPHIYVNGKTRLFDVLAQARIPSSANLFKSYVSRCGCPLAIDFHQLLNEGDMSQNIVMRPRDKIFIADARDAAVCVMGEVGFPRAVNLNYGSMSLREALVAAGGIPFTGDRKHIQVIRGGIVCPKVYVLDWCHITQLPNESLLLMPGDTVYVAEKPITTWNRFISQLVPSIGCFQSGLGFYSAVLALMPVAKTIAEGGATTGAAASTSGQ